MQEFLFTIKLLKRGGIMKKTASLILSLTLFSAISFNTSQVSAAAVQTASQSLPISSSSSAKESESALKVNPDIVTQKETDAAMDIIKEIATTYGNRYSESDANIKCREFIRKKLQASGYKVIEEEFTNKSSRWSVDSDGVTTGVNIIASSENPDLSKKNVIFVSHYDSFFGAPGANDNGTGVASNIILSEFLKDMELSYNPVFLFVDAEELGLLGSQEYVNLHKDELTENTELVVNTDMTGKGDQFLICTVRKQSLENKYSLMAMNIGKELGLNMGTVNIFGSDYAHFEAAGMPSFGIANDSGALSGKDPNYHTPTDIYENVDTEAVQDTLRFLFNIALNI